MQRRRRTDTAGALHYAEDPNGFFRNIDIPITPEVERGYAAQETAEIKAILNEHVARGAIALHADTLAVVAASAAATPAYATYGKATSTQGGVRMVVNKIEAAPDETRVYVSVNNRSADDFSFYGSSAKLVANGRSIKTSYSGDYPEPASDVASHSRTSGVILFERIPRGAALRLILEGYSDNMDVGKYGSLSWTFTWK